MALRPRALPKLRDQTLRHLDDATSAIRTGTGADNAPGLDALGRHLRAAEMYWVAPDMAALAVSAGSQLAAARWATADRPAPCGLLVWGGGVGHIDTQGVEVPVEAAAWGPVSGGCGVWLLMSRDRLAGEVRDRGQYALVENQIPPLVPIAGWTLAIDEPLPMADLPESAPVPVFAALAAAWLLMQQPQLIDRTREPADNATLRAYHRQQLPDPEITVIDLRRQYVPDLSDPDAERSGRRYRHRWVVSGHWRDQAYGPDRSLRRQTWIPAYVKGPEGAPLLATERVNVWRR